MKSNWQIGFAILILMGIVLGAAYVTQYTKPSEIPKLAPIPPGPVLVRAEPMIKFDNETAVWRKDLFSLSAEDDREKFIRPVELGAKNHYDFWVHNPQPDPVAVAVKFTSCTCSDVQYAVFPTDAWATWQGHAATAGCLEALGPINLLGPAAVVPLLGSITWKALPIGALAEPELQPAARNGAPGMVRVNFQPKKLSGDPAGETLKVTIRGQGRGGANDDVDLFVKYEVVPPLGFFPFSLDVEEIAAGGKSERELLVWSMTRDTFEPQLVVSTSDPQVKSDPCIEIGKPIFLSPKEAADMPKALAAEFPKQMERLKGMRIASACRIPVTVHERRGDRQLDMGPIQRTLSLTSEGTIDALRIPLTGLVHGEVRLHGGDDHDRVALASFKLDRGVTRSVTLVSSRLSLDLAIYETTGTPLKPTLSPPETVGGQKRWRLTIEVPPDSNAGELLSGTAVVLVTKDKLPRKMRIPVTGTAAR